MDWPPRLDLSTIEAVRHLDKEHNERQSTSKEEKGDVWRTIPEDP